MRDLGIGALTSISNANSNKKPTGNDLSADFVVSAISGAREGATETAQARADLNSNNQHLEIAYQKLAKANSLITIAKVIQVQNRMLASEMATTPKKLSDIGTKWGQSPVISQGSGISLGFDDYAKQINSSTSSDDIKQMLAQMRQAKIDWNSLNRQLEYIKKELTAT